jgi:hypothetical protein
MHRDGVSKTIPFRYTVFSCARHVCVLYLLAHERPSLTLNALPVTNRSRTWYVVRLHLPYVIHPTQHTLSTFRLYKDEESKL